MSLWLSTLLWQTLRRHACRALIICASMAQVLSVPLTARAEDSLPNPVAVRITPAYPPRAALQYRLYPRFVEFLPGDAAAFYIKAVLLYQTQNQAETVTRKNDPKYNERVGDWLEMPVSELPLDEAKVCLKIIVTP